MAGIFGILESSATQWQYDVAPIQEFFFFIVTSIVYAYETHVSTKMQRWFKEKTN
jgi:hypothetical protein